ncbi:hypothetical protein ACSBR1_008201 [Camellia fascicularis]
MTVGTETSNLATSPEEQDYLDRSKKKVKPSDAHGEDLLEIQGNKLDKPDEQMTDDADVGNVNLGKPPVDNLGSQRSFKQALLRSRFNETERERSFDSEAAYLSSDEEMDNEEEAEVDSETQRKGLNPIIKLPASLLKKVREPWKNCLIVRLLGKNIGYNLFVNRMRRLWNLQAGFEALDIGNGFFIVKFEVMEDYTKVFTGGPWVVMDRYVTVRKWQPDFKSDEAEADITAIWVRFPNLPIEYYDEKVLYHIAKVLGKPLKVDINTAMAARGKYARVCVEMDLRKPLISHLTIGRYHYVVEYEHLNLLCFACGRVGHRKEKCPDFPMIQPEKTIPNMTVTQPGTEVGSREKQPDGQVNKELSMEPETHGYGPWTLVTTRRKHQHGKQKQKHHVYKSNRFESLQTKQDQGETSKAQDIIPDQCNYVDLDMAPQAIKEDLSYVHTQSPHGTNEHMKDVGAISRMDGVTGPKEKEMICCVSPQSTNTTGPQTSPDGSNAQGNPIANPVTTAALTGSNSNVLNTVIAPVICVPNSNVRSPDFSTSKEEHFNGGHGREPPTVQAPSGSIPSPDVLRTRERSVSPHRHRLVARRGEAADSTLVGDRFTHREAYGACETREDAGGRPEECAKSFGSD